jgi:hypothetical protein
MSEKRKFYRVVSGTMRVLTWANSDKQAVTQAINYRRWRYFGELTKFQWRMKSGAWSPWFYIATKQFVKITPERP